MAPAFVTGRCESERVSRSRRAGTARRLHPLGSLLGRPPSAALLGTSAPALPLHMASIPPIRRLAHVVSVSGLVLFWSQKPDLVPKMQASPPFSEGGALKAAGCSAWKRRQSNPPPASSSESAWSGTATACAPGVRRLAHSWARRRGRNSFPGTRTRFRCSPRGLRPPLPNSHR